MKTGCDVIQAQEEVVKNKEAELENTRKQLKEKSEGLSLKEAEFIDLEKVNKNWHKDFFFLNVSIKSSCLDIGDHSYIS